MNFEKFLNDEIGFGWYQVLLYLILGTSILRSTFDLEVNVFQTELPAYTCLRNESTYQNVTSIDSDQCLWNDNMNVTHRCSNFEFSNQYMHSTIATRYNLLCESKYWLYLLQSLYFSGYLVGFFVGSFGDRFGRRKIIIMFGILDIVTAPLPAFVTTYTGHAILKFLRGIPGVAFHFSITLISEFCPTRMRSLAVNFGYLFWCFGYISAAACAYLLRDWRLLQYAAIPVSSYVVLMYWIPESPSWLLLRGRRMEARKICASMARVNRRLVNSTVIDSVVTSRTTMEATGRYTDLFRTPLIRKYTIVYSFSIFVCALAYYGLSINAQFVHDNGFFTIGMYGVIEIPTVFVSWYLSEHYGRRPTIIIMAITAAISILATTHVPRSLFDGILHGSVALIGFFAVNTAYLIICLYGVELFPTSLRYMGSSFGWLISTIGMMAAPHINGIRVVHYALPSAVFGFLLLIITVIIGVSLPETKDRLLPQTVSEMADCFQSKVKINDAGDIDNWNDKKEKEALQSV